MSTLVSFAGQRRMRSWLFTPATRPDRFANASRCGADVLVLDLEDAVAPAEKDAARDNVRRWLEGSGEASGQPLTAVRINSGSTRGGLHDLLMVLDVACTPDLIILPKVECAEQVARVEALLRESGKSTALVAMIESARGMRAAAGIARAAEARESGARAAGGRVASGLVGLMLGAADYAADVGLESDARAMQVARCQLTAACGGTRVIAIDAPCFALREPQKLQSELQSERRSELQSELVFARANGFVAKAAIHPMHVEAINAVFTPSPERVGWARRVLEVTERGTGTIEGRMVDEAMARQARRVIAQSVAEHINVDPAVAGSDAGVDPGS